MDFSIFDHRDNMTALTWLGKKPWLSYKDFPEKRAVFAGPKKILIKPRKIPEDKNVIIVGEKEYNRHPEEMWTRLKEIVGILEYDIIGSLWYDTLSKALAGGPKIFRPTADQCEALQHAEARFSFKDYHQPFPVIILEIPPEYKENLKNQYGIDESPNYVLINHDEANKFITVSAFFNKSNIITHITPDRPEYETIEDSLVVNRNRRADRTGRLDRADENQFDAAENVQRLAINFAMMMSLYSVKVVGALDASNYRTWEQEAKNKRKDGQFTNAAREAQTNIAAALQLIEFDQKVEFYDQIEENIEIASAVDIEKLQKSPKSHWRRGHFAMQACGVGRKDHKLIFRKPVLVRANYFLGDVKNASVTYTMLPGKMLPEVQGIKIGSKIEVLSTEESPVSPGTVGKIIKIVPLGSGVVQIVAETEDLKFILLSPPDTYKILEKL